MKIATIGGGIWLAGLVLSVAIAFTVVAAGSDRPVVGDADDAASTHAHATAAEAHADATGHTPAGHAPGGHAHTALSLGAAAEGSIYHLDHAWRDQHGHLVELAAFTGGPVLVTMFYGNCQTACPLLLHKARLLQQELGGSVPVLAVTFDPVSDTPEAMRRYAAERGFERDSWHFLMGSQTSIRMLATLLGVQFHKRADGHFDHSNLIALLDADGVIRLRSEGLSPDVAPLAAQIEQLGLATY